MSAPNVSIFVALSGLVGAVIGGIASYLGARQQAKASSDAQAAAWRRDRRAEAYVELLEARERLSGLSAPGKSPTRYMPDVEGLRGLRRAVSMAWQKVELFGSEEAQGAVTAWIETLDGVTLGPDADEKQLAEFRGREDSAYVELRAVLRRDVLGGRRTRRGRNFRK